MLRVSLLMTGKHFSLWFRRARASQEGLSLERVLGENFSLAAAAFPAAGGAGGRAAFAACLLRKTLSLRTCQQLRYRYPRNAALPPGRSQRRARWRKGGGRRMRLAADMRCAKDKRCSHYAPGSISSRIACGGGCQQDAGDSRVRAISRARMRLGAASDINTIAAEVRRRRGAEEGDSLPFTVAAVISASLYSFSSCLFNIPIPLRHKKIRIGYFRTGRTEYWRALR